MTDMNLPWHIANDPAPGWEGHVYGANGMIVATACTQEIARRIVACVNRLEPFSTESIEDAGCDLFSYQILTRRPEASIPAANNIHGEKHE